MIKKEFVCLYPNDILEYEKILTYTKELSFEKTYVCELHGSNILGLINNKGDYKKYNADLFVDKSLYKEMSYDEKKSKLADVYNMVFVEKYPEDYNFKKHETKYFGTSRLEQVFIDYIISIMSSRMKSQVLEMHLDNTTTLKLLLYGKPQEHILKDKIWRHSLNTKTTLQSQDFKYFKLQKERKGKLGSLLRNR